LLPHYSFGTKSHIDYITNANEQVLIAVQIETAQAVQNIEAILNVPGIDLVFIGPFDLHISLGLPPALWSDLPTFQHNVQTVIAACKRHNIPYGTISPHADGAISRITDGFTFVGIGTDIGHMISGLNAQIERVRPTR
jgi:2-keto-3-deoxy-L-rhamnonate aldolase RhmA